MITKTVGHRLRKLRKNLGLTQKEFAQKVPGEVDCTYIGKIERGDQYPSLKMLEKIGKAFSVPLGYFFEAETMAHLVDLLPSDITNLIKDKERQNLLRLSRNLSQRDLALVGQIVGILSKGELRPALAGANPPDKHHQTRKERTLHKSQ